MNVQEKAERKSFAARMLVPLLLLVFALFIFQYWVVSGDLHLTDPQLIQSQQSSNDQSIELVDLRALPEPSGVDTPQSTVLKAIDDLKQTQDARVILNYVWWDANFAKLTEYLGQRMSIRNPRQMYNFYFDSLTSSGSLSLRQLAYDSARLPEKRRQAVLKFVQSQRSDVMPTPFTAFSKTYFEVISEEKNAENALVILRKTEQGKSSELKIPLLKVGNRWMLECVEFVNDPLSVCNRN